MVTRREALGLFGIFAEILTSTPVQAQASASGAPAPNSLVFKQDLPNLSLDDWEVTVRYVDYAPGRVGAPHRHPGFVLAYVLEGAVVAKISGQGEEKTYTVGQMFYEQPGAIHEVSKNASQTEPARLLALLFAKKGAKSVTPAIREG